MQLGRRKIKLSLIICSILISIFIIIAILFNYPDRIPLNDESNENGLNFMNKTREIVTKIDLSGYCYNPEYPDYGSSSENIMIDLKEQNLNQIVSQYRMYYYFYFLDDHYEMIDPRNTGDIMTITTYCYNNTNKEYIDFMEQTSFEGGSEITQTSYCDADGRGSFFDSKWHIDIEISNCGEYPKYGGPGLFTEPDQGNEWNATFTFIYFVEV